MVDTKDAEIMHIKYVCTVCIMVLKMPVLILSVIPQFFFKHTEILVPEIKLYLEDKKYEVACAKSE